MQRIFVGDVQGCADELDELLERARADWGDAAEIWWVGDLVNRGPDNLRVLRRVRELCDAGRGHCVLGNHELGLLRIALGLAELGERDTYGDVLAAPDADDWIDWLRRRPLVLDGTLGQQRFAMVHAASHPDWDLSELLRRARGVEERLRAPDRSELRDWLSGAAEPGDDRDVLARLVHCRSVDGRGGWSEQPPQPGTEPWHRAWSRRAPGFGVVYGHWSLQGLHVAPGLRGLDTGCVHHGRGRDGALTAWLPDASSPTPFDVPDDGFWQIPARRAYYGSGASRS